MAEESRSDGHSRGKLPLRLPLKITLVSWLDLAQTLGPFLLLSVAAIWVAVHFMRSAPPHLITMSSGPAGSTFATVSERYRRVLARNGITLRILESQGSIENLGRLTERASHVDIALVQAGLPAVGNTSDLVSLGSMFYQPLTVFYRSSRPLQRLSELNAKRIAVGAEGSGTRYLALALLAANEIEPGGTTQLLPLEGEAARKALLRGQVDAIVLAGDSAAPATIREMLHQQGVRLFEFTQASAYVRRFPYLNKLLIPAGAFDLGENLPPTDIDLLAPTVELIAHSSLHPAVCDLLIEAAMEVHRHPSLLQSAGQFPNAISHTFPLSEEAGRYYKSGDRSLAYRYLPFWLASLLDRILIVLLPVIVVVIPGLRYLPQLYNWRVNSRIHRRYAELMAVERESLGSLTEERRAALLDRLSQMERQVITRRMPGSHAEQVYLLRQHISFVRRNLSHSNATGGEAPAMDASGS